MTEELVPQDVDEDPLQLTLKQKSIAALDALGWKRSDIADTIGVNVSYISHLRRNKFYRELLATYLSDDEVRAGLRTTIMRLNTGAEKAIETLLEQMDAVDGDGRALPAVRLGAAGKYLDQWARVMTAAGRSEEGGDTAPPPSATITVNLIRGEDGSVQPVIEDADYEVAE